MKRNYLLLLLTTLIVSNTLPAQIALNSPWTWMKGDNINFVAPVYGSKGLAAPGNNPGRRTLGLSWTDASGNLWLFGGFDNDYHNDLWKYSPSINQWTWVSGTNSPNDVGTYGSQGVPSTSNAPASRAGATGWIDASGNFWVFGGTATTSDISVPYGIEALNDLWKYNPSTNEWTWINGSSTTAVGNYGTKGVEAPGNSPGARGGAMGWADNSGNMWLFGGNVVYTIGLSATPFNDMWRYNPSTNQWTWMNGPAGQGGSIHGAQGTFGAGNIPFSKSNATALKDPMGNFWMFGGVTVSGTWSDVWKFDPLINQWAWMKGDPDNYNAPGNNGTLGVADPSNNPISRYNAAGYIDAYGNLLIFGGTSEGQCACIMYDDLWRYNMGSNQWTLIKADNSGNQAGIYGSMGVPDAANKPGSRFGQFSWSDASGNFWLYGGDGFDINGARGYLSDLWEISPCSNAINPVINVSVTNSPVTEGDPLNPSILFTFTLSSPGSCQYPSVNYKTVDGTATAGQDYMATSGTVTFPTGVSTVTVAVPVIDDALNETNVEHLTLQLSNPLFATLATTSVGAGIRDNDPEPSISINNVTVYEDVGQAMLTVSLSAVSGQDVRVRYRTFNGTATQPQDYTRVNNAQITIPAGSTSATANVSIINDGVPEPTENFTVQLSNAQNAGIAVGTGTVTIMDGPAPLTNRSVLPGKENSPDKNFEVKVFNNPSSNGFSIEFRSTNDERMGLRVLDMTGRVVEQKENLRAGQLYRIGDHYPTGVYFAEVTQGTQRKVVKLVKQ